MPVVSRTVSDERDAAPMKKRKQHFVWRRYLAAWAKDEQITCARGRATFVANVRDVAQERDFYRLEELTAEDLYWLRRLIAKLPPESHATHEQTLHGFVMPFKLRRFVENTDVAPELHAKIDELIQNLEEDLHGLAEDKALPLLQSLCEGDTSFFAKLEHFCDFMHFIALQDIRTKKRRERLLASLTGLPLDPIRTWGPLRHIVAVTVAGWFVLRRSDTWISILEAMSGSEFITGDQPVVNTHAVGMAPYAIPDSLQYYYPVSPHRAVVVGTGARDFSPVQQVNGVDVDYCNYMIAKHAHEQVFGTTTEIVERSLRAATSGEPPNSGLQLTWPSLTLVPRS
jgi:hypothetical protein